MLGLRGFTCGALLGNYLSQFGQLKVLVSGQFFCPRGHHLLAGLLLSFYLIFFVFIPPVFLVVRVHTLYPVVTTPVSVGGVAFCCSHRLPGRAKRFLRHSVALSEGAADE